MKPASCMTFALCLLPLTYLPHILVIKFSALSQAMPPSPPSKSSIRKRPQASELATSKCLRPKAFVPGEGERSGKEDSHHLKKTDIPDDASQLKVRVSLTILILS